MLKQNLVLTDRDQIEGILKACTTCRIAMVDQGKPYIIPMVFGYRWDEEGLTLYFHCGLRGTKNRALRENPQVCVEMDLEGELMGSGSVGNRYSRSFSSIIGEGRVEFAQNPAECRRGFDYIMRHQTGRDGFTYDNAYLAVAQVFRVRLDHFTALRKNPTPGGHVLPNTDPSQERQEPGHPVFTEDDG